MSILDDIEDKQIKTIYINNEEVDIEEILIFENINKKITNSSHVYNND